MYEPQQLQVPKSIIHYVGTLLGAEYEVIAQQNILASQQAGHWVALEIPEGVVITERVRNLDDIIRDTRQDGRPFLIEELRLQAMKNLGFLSKKDDGWYLSEEAIARIAEKYPAQPADN